MGGFSFPLDDTEQFRIGSQVSDDIICLTVVMSLREKVKTAINHFYGDGSKRLTERFGNVISEIYQNSIK